MTSPTNPDAPFLTEWLAARRATGPPPPPGASPPHRGSRRRAALVVPSLGLDRPDLAQRTVGVVGSKGKGTAVLYTAATLAAAGLRAGSVTGPGLRSGRDRIRINGTALSPAAYRQLGELVTKTLARLPPPADPAEYISPS
ncbi:MAG: hypothetical protein LBH48_08055, partial [Bifidobacteriaceae bacterium]|nr:hypothetical protein [Bifidobacteriaceae bacterium]